MADRNCVTLIWKISNLFKAGTTVESPEFIVNSLRESVWTLRLNIPTSWSEEVNIDLQNKYYKGRRQLWMDLEISILAENPLDAIDHFQRMNFRFKTYYRAFGFPSWNYLSRSHREDFFLDGDLTIQCKLWEEETKHLTDMTPLFYQAYTRFAVREISFDWSLKFSDLKKGKVKNKTFFLGYNEPIFRVETYKDHRQNELGFSIEQQNTDFDDLPLSCKISVLDAWGNVTIRKEWSTELYVNNVFEFPRFIDVEDLRSNECIKNNKLELIFAFAFEIHEEEDCAYSEVENISTIPPETFIQSQSTSEEEDDDEEEEDEDDEIKLLCTHRPLRSIPNMFTPVKKTTADVHTLTDNESDLITQALKDNMHDMYVSNSWSDVVLEAGGRSYQCHKCILSSRSPVFHSLLSDSTTYTLELKASVLGSMLQFIYTGDIGTQMDFQIALELYEAATEYQVVSLKNVCSKFLEDNMTEENVFEVLIMAFKLEDINMKTRTENFILKRAANILGSDKWKDLVKNDAKHIVEIMHRIYLAKEKGGSSNLMSKEPVVSTIPDNIEKSREEHKSNFLSIFQSSLFSDFELCNKAGKTFTVHKNILWTRSPVFKAMLSSNMRESSIKTLDTADLDEQTLDRLIRFMYTATMEVSELDELSKLYYAADKYHILSLKNWCSKSLIQALSLKNVCEVLKMSDQHGKEELKNEVLDFLAKNSENVVLSPEWKNLMETDSQLASEAMYQILARKTNMITVNSEIESEKSHHLSESNRGNFSEIHAATIFQVDLVSLYEEKCFSDCKLCTNDRTFEVHKNILCASSPVFNAMFSSNLEEATTNILVIPDIDGQTVDQMLRYVYTGTFEDTESVDLCMLYYAADKYQINSLRNWCSRLLSEKISVENVCDILLLTNRHGDMGLETAVENFLIKNSKEVFNSDSWKAFMLNEPEVSCQTLLAIY